MEIFRRQNGQPFTVSPLILISLAIVIVLFLSSCATFFTFVGVRNESITRENQLTAQYLDNQNFLSSYISGFREQTGVAMIMTDSIQNVLVEAVKGRYDDSGFGTDSALFFAIAEAYPDVNGLTTAWTRIIDYISAQREGYRNQQSKLLDMLRSYDTWRETGILKPLITSILGVPTHRLKADVGDTVLTGDLALAKMYEIVLTQEAVDAYEDSRMEPLQIPTRTP